MEMENRHNNRIVVGMSGGVDSSVAAALLKEQGYDVVGITMQLWDFDSGSHSVCCSVDSVKDASSVCRKIGIPHYVIDLREQFNRAVVDNFINEYINGRTPNPCVVCNNEIKWGSLLRKARELGADRIATGHYAQIARERRFSIRCGLDKTKDQSYFLWGLRQEMLKRTLFPLGGQTKEKTRKIAEDLGLNTAHKAESQEICFVPDGDYRNLLLERAKRMDSIPASLQNGQIVDKDGQIVGRHMGVSFYTVGQRKGVGIALGKPVYVTDIDVQSNTLRIGDVEDLRQSEFTAAYTNWISIDPPQGSIQARVKIRYGNEGAPGVVTVLGDERVSVQLEESQKAITPGQSAVFYDGDILLGGGIIES